MELLEYGTPGASRILIQPVDDHDLSVMESEVSWIRKMVGDNFRLIAVKIADWNGDLSPWEAPPVYGTEAFSGHADRTLEEILDLIRESGSADAAPARRETEGLSSTPDSQTAASGKKFFIGGYSLAGLFALWAATKTDLFSGAAAASPSVWFPGFPEYLRQNPVRSGRIYLSLGDREERTKNPVMAEVGNSIRSCHSILQGNGVSCTLEWNPGNHFRDPDIRTAKAFAWVLG